MSLTDPSPWIALAGVGALHGLLPAGWLCMAAWTGPNREPGPMWRALIAVALGHLASLALVAVVAVLAISRGWSWPTGAGWTADAVALVLLAVSRWTRLGRARPQLVLAAAVFVLSSGHGAGLMLVPAWLPLCLGDGAMRQIAATGSAALVVVAVGLHLIAMLSVTGLAAVARPVWALSAQRAEARNGARERGFSRRSGRPA